MDDNGRVIKDRVATEQKILDAVGEIILEDGFEKIGINAVAQKAGVSKVLIYRYFGDMDELLAKYVLQKDYWVNVSVSLPQIESLGGYLKEMFRKQIEQLRKDVILKRLYRWELSVNNDITNQIISRREQNGLFLVEAISRLTQSLQKEVAALASILSASISHLALLEEACPKYNGIDIQSNNGWEQLALGIDLIIDLWINYIKR